MPTHSTVEAKNNLSALIDRALAGEEVVITRHGHPVVALRPIAAAQPATAPPAADPPVGRRITEADLDWLRQRREARGSAPAEDAATTVRRMRDEGP